MADLSWHQNRIREGARGGQEQFQWDSVKGMSWKDREVYLGASQKVGTMGRYGNFSRSDWWRHERGSGTTRQQEQQAIREFEDELMQEALGQKPKKLLLSKQQLTAREMQMALAKDDPDQAGAEDDSGANIESAKGLGFAVHRTADLEAKKARLYGMNDEYEGTGEATEGGQQVNGAAGGSSSSTSSKFEPAARMGGAGGAGPQEGEASAKDDILRKYGAQQSASVPSNGEQLGSNGGRSPRLFGEGGGEEDEGGSAKKTAAWSSTFPPAAGGPKSGDVPMGDASSEPSPSKEVKKPKLPKEERRALKQQKREAKKQKKARKKLEKKEKKRVKKEKKEAKKKAKRRKYEKKHRLRDSSSEDSDSSSGSTSDSSSRS